MSGEKIVNALRLSVAGARKMGLYPGKSRLWETMEQAADLAKYRAEGETGSPLMDVMWCVWLTPWMKNVQTAYQPITARTDGGGTNA